jgi:hypothetical protein
MSQARVSTTPRIARTPGRAVAGGPWVQRSRIACWVPDSPASMSSRTRRAVWRTVSPRRITTLAAGAWLPRGNAETSTAARAASNPNRTSAWTLESRASTSSSRRHTQVLWQRRRAAMAPWLKWQSR